MPLIICLIILFFQNVWSNGSARGLRLLTQNIQCNPKNNGNNLRKLINFSDGQDIDVIAIQEYCTDLKNPNFNDLEILKTSFPFLYVYFTHPAYDKFGEYLVIASKKQPQKYLEGKLPPSPLQRGFQALLFSNIAIVNTHLSHLEDPTYRKNQINFLANINKKLEIESIIIMGDFNCSPFSQESENFWQNFWRPIFPYTTHIDKETKRQSRLDGLWIKGLSIQFSQQNFIPVPSIDSDHRGVGAQIN